MKRTAGIVRMVMVGWVAGQAGLAVADPLAWPPLAKECRPWAYWWWLGSAVDATNLTAELDRYHEAGMGGLHAIPIYGAKGYEAASLPYLSPAWMAMLDHAIREARRLGMDVDMTTGTGWCFGGPNIDDRLANAAVVAKSVEVAAGAALTQTFDPESTQALVAFDPQGRAVDLTGRIQPGGKVDWTAEGGPWTVWHVTQQPSGRKVKRAAPGGEGPMLNLIYPEAIRHYLQRFTEAFAGYTGLKPRAMYHDSYEYQSNWAPDFFDQFEKRRGYRLQTELPALFGADPTDHAARVKSDYRQTVSELISEVTLPVWTDWARQQGFLTRNQAHGSPGNLLDLYALADIPETEMFNKDRSILVSKFASSAAHVVGRPLVASETGTWLREHFTETLADLKNLVDELFLAGVNHVIYHGTCYSPDSSPWPGWLFYASTQMNPRNSIWRDVPALNLYIARCQSVLQSGHPDSDLLVYWPIHDLWHDPAGLLPHLTVHHRDWLDRQPLGKTAQFLWQRGFAFDYVSDRMLAGAGIETNRVRVPGGRYQAVVVPACQRMPVAVFGKLLELASQGATVIFEQDLPADVPGLGDLEQRRAELQRLRGSLQFGELVPGTLRQTQVGSGRVLAGDLETALAQAGVRREPMADQAGLFCMRRAFEGGRHYFIANRGEQPRDGWITLATAAGAVVLMDPLSGQTGQGAWRSTPDGLTQVYLQLPPGASIIVRTLSDSQGEGPPWPYWRESSPAVELQGTWRVDFLQGGPRLPTPIETQTLRSWTDLGGDDTRSFAGTARYTLLFDAPSTAPEHWFLNLGQVAQSARVRLNGQDLGTLFVAPWRSVVTGLALTNNLLEIEVTNVSANRIRDLDRRQVPWRNFHDINFVNIDYQPFDASGWPLTASGLLGPVTLQPVEVLVLTPAPPLAN